MMIDQDRRSRINQRLSELKFGDRIVYEKAKRYYRRECGCGTLTEFHLTATEKQIAKLERMIGL